MFNLIVWSTSHCHSRIVEVAWMDGCTSWGCVRASHFTSISLSLQQNVTDMIDRTFSSQVSHCFGVIMHQWCYTCYTNVFVHVLKNCQLFSGSLSPEITMYYSHAFRTASRARVGSDTGKMASWSQTRGTRKWLRTAEGTREQCVHEITTKSKKH